MKREIQIFFTALMFYTRIPCPKWVTHDAEYLNKATRYFPLIGWLAGLVSFFIYMGGRQLFTNEVSIVLSMVAGVLLTGAFHEDGFADVCDGFGGGWTKEKILTIMKDSRVGTYGVAGLVLLLLLKFLALDFFSTFTIAKFGIVLIVAHTVSRLSAIFIIYTSAYVREDQDSKAKPVAQPPGVKDLLIACFFAVLPLSILCTINVYFLLILAPVFLMTLYLRNYFKKWIGGYTGDCLGATQQVNEVVIYLSILAICRFI